MSVIVSGMEMPKSCFGCHLFNLDDQDLWCIANHYAGYCRELSKYIDEDKFVKERHPDCPLIEVPPHGKLIDANEIEYENWYLDETGESYKMVGKDDIDGMSTIIEAED